MRTLTSPWIGRSTLIGIWMVAAGVALGCGPGETTTQGGGGTTTTTTPTTGGGGTTTTGGTAGTGGTTGGTSTGGTTGGTTTGGTTTGGTTGTGGMTTTGEVLCTTIQKNPTRGSAIAINNDDSVIVAVNRDVGTATVYHVDYPANVPNLTKITELTVGAKDSEPWQVAMDACGSRAYVVTRKEQKVVELLGLDTANPTVGSSVAVGSEPTGIAITPNNAEVYVTNWVDGTVNAITTKDMQIVNTIDLNKTLADTGLLGTVTPRPALAHPRAIAITNNGDNFDNDEQILVTEWFALRTAPDALAGVTIDTNWKGIVYKFGVDSNTVTTVDLPPVMDTGFPDHNNAATGCFPNQVGSITIDNGFAYVTSTCASPKGPIGVFTGKNAGGVCTVLTEAADCGAVGGVCNPMTLTCNPNPTDVKTTTHPAVTVFNVASGAGLTTVNLDAKFNALPLPTRMPLLPSDIAFKNGFAYVSSIGTDALYRVNTAGGAIGAAGSAQNNFITLRKDMMDKLIRNPIGVVTANTAGLFAFVNNDGAREVQSIDLGTQALLAGFPSSDLPAAGSQEEKVLRGKRFFQTGLGRWSFGPQAAGMNTGGQGWGSCAVCHIDGLTDNITWYFARGPRQSVSLDGSFSSKDGTDQRIFNWTGIFDEVADFENNTRGISGGVGAIVSVVSDPPVNADRINTATQTPPQQGLQGSSADTANPMGIQAHPHSVLNDWAEITEWVKTVRSPRKPTNLVAADVAAGKILFDSAQGNCVGCHSGAKWTISNVFWPVGDAANAATNCMNPPDANCLSLKDWLANGVNGFPAALQPVAMPNNNTRDRFGAAPAFEQIQCIMRPVGTIKGGVDTSSVSPAAVGVLELRQDMLTKGQGSGEVNTAADPGRGFNPPSLLGMQVGAPYFHAGNARTLEEAFDALFVGHYQSPIASIFNPNATEKAQLVAYILSIDEDETAFMIPAKGNKGGDICFF